MLFQVCKKLGSMYFTSLAKKLKHINKLPVMKKIILAFSVGFILLSCNDSSVVNGPISNDSAADMPAETTTNPDGTTSGAVISRDTSAMSVDNVGNVLGGDSSTTH